jgi:hypothetical protein
VIPQKKRSRNWNKVRLTNANEEDKKVLSKYYLETKRAFINVTIQGPNDWFDPPTWFLKNAREVAGMALPTPDKAVVMFAMTKATVEHNTQLLQYHHWDFDKFLWGQQETTLAYGSEF